MKTKEIKNKVASKVAKGKAKVAKTLAKKLAKCIIVAFAIGLAGCQNPAQRAQTCSVTVYAYDASTITLGQESVTLAQSNETGRDDAGLTASPTTTVSPDIDVSVPVNKANAGTSGVAVGAAEKLLGAGADYLATKMNGTENQDENAAQNAAQNDCPNGDCSTCPDGTCTRPQN